MFCDDANGLVIDLGHHRSYAGFIGEESPSYCCDSQYAFFQQANSDSDHNSIQPIFTHNGRLNFLLLRVKKILNLKRRFKKNYKA